MRKIPFRSLTALFLALLMLLFGCGRSAVNPSGGTTSEAESTDLLSDSVDTETSEASFFSEKNPISEYVLVYGDIVGRYAAELIAEAISETFGISLPVIEDAAPETEREILVGVTDRSDSASISDRDPYLYVVKTVGTKLLIGGASEYAVLYGGKTFIHDYVEGTVDGGLLYLPCIYERESPCYILKDSSELSEGAEIRIMSWNLLNETAAYPIDSRAMCAAATIREYRPDVIGTQETSSGWYRELNQLLDGEYSYVTSIDEDGEENYSTLWYRPDTVRLIDSGVLNYEYAAVKKMRIVTWGIFEHLQSGKRFIATSTHWDREVESPSGVNITRQAEELAALLLRLREDETLPTFSVGDYNRVPGTKQYKLFLELTEFGDAPLIAELVKREVPTYHEVGSDELKVGLVDHIFCSSESRVLLYATVIDPVALDASDHCPIYIDVSLSDAAQSAS